MTVLIGKILNLWFKFSISIYSSNFGPILREEKHGRRPPVPETETSPLRRPTSYRIRWSPCWDTIKAPRQIPSSISLRLQVMARFDLRFSFGDEASQPLSLGLQIQPLLQAHFLNGTSPVPGLRGIKRRRWPCSKKWAPLFTGDSWLYENCGFLQRLGLFRRKPRLRCVVEP